MHRRTSLPCNFFPDRRGDFVLDKFKAFRMAFVCIWELHHLIVVGLLVEFVLIGATAALPESQNVSAFSVANELHKTILKSETCNPAISPQWPHGKFTPVGLHIWPQQLTMVNDRDQLVGLRYYIVLTWNDSRLAWPKQFHPNLNDSVIDPLNAAQNGYIAPQNYALIVNRDQIWTPHIRSSEAETSEGSELKVEFTRVFPDGKVVMSGELNDKQYCAMRTRFFPFDKQVCALTIHSSLWVHLTADVISESGMQGIYEDRAAGKLALTYDIGEWSMFEAYEDVKMALVPARRGTAVGEHTSTVRFRIVLTRRPWKQIMTWMVPPVTLCYGTIVSLFVGCKVSDRYALCSAMLITMSVFFSSFMQHLASGVDGYPILAQLYMGLALSLTLAMLIAPLPEWLATRYGTRTLRCRRVRGKVEATTVHKFNIDKQNFAKEKQNKPNAAEVRFWDMWAMMALLTLQTAVLIMCIVQWFIGPSNYD